MCMVVRLIQSLCALMYVRIEIQHEAKISNNKKDNRIQLFEKF